MIKIKKIPLEEALSLSPIPKEALSNYLRTMPDIIEKTDIFYENSRSYNQVYKNFSLFQEVTVLSKDAILLYPVYLELYEYSGLSVMSCIDKFSKKYPYNKILFQWNHDVDFSSKYAKTVEYKNVYIINFNTSIPNRNDIIVPFWAFDTTPFHEEKKYFAGLIVSPNNQLRHDLMGTIKDKEGYIYKYNLAPEEFSRTISQCWFSFCPRGQGLSSYRFYSCFHLNTIPVLFADKSALPFKGHVDYEKIIVRLPESTINDFNYINGILNRIDKEAMLDNIERIKNKFSLLGVQEEIHNRILNEI